MKKLIIVCCIILSYLSLSAQGLIFERCKDWMDVKSKAKKENKFILVDVYATWCGPCKAMDSLVYKSEKLNSFNRSFISIKVQTDSTKHDDIYTKSWYSNATWMMRAFDVSIFPTILFFNSDGELVSKAIGYNDIDNFIIVCNEAMDPNRQYYTLLKRWRSSELSYSEMPELARRAYHTNDLSIAQRIANDYIENYLFKLPHSKLHSRENLAFIGDFLGDAESNAFRYYLDNLHIIDSVLGPNYGEYKLKHIIARDYMPDESTWKGRRIEWNQIESKVVKKFGSLGKEVVYGRRMLYDITVTKDWSSFGSSYQKYFILALSRPDYDVNNITWVVFQNVIDHNVLEFACDVVMPYSLEKWYKSDPVSYDTYANLLYKLGRRDSAIEWEEKAVRMKKGAVDEKLYTDALAKMRSNMPTWE